MAKATDTATDKDASLKRLGGGRWQTRDERFTIEPQSGTWVVVDGTQTDDLGLPLVRGPFGSLGAAKEAIATARQKEPARSPLAARLRDRPAARSVADGARPRNDSASDRRPEGSRAGSRDKRTGSSRSVKPALAEAPAGPAEPRWLLALEPADRRRAKRLIDRLGDAGAADPEGIARRDIVGEVPAAAAFALVAQIKALGDDASPTRVARLLAEGRDDNLGVRWHLVDAEGRPITLELHG